MPHTCNYLTASLLCHYVSRHRKSRLQDLLQNQSMCKANYATIQVMCNRRIHSVLCNSAVCVCGGGGGGGWGGRLHGHRCHQYLCIIDWGLKELSEVLVVWHVLIPSLLPRIYSLQGKNRTEEPFLSWPACIHSGTSI